MTSVVEKFGITPRPRRHPATELEFVLPTRHMGVEIEVEQNSDAILPGRSTLAWWDVKSDNSLLRGREYVLRNPEMGNNLGLAVEEIFSVGRFYPAATSSTHIHLDAREQTVTPDVMQVLFSLVYCMEPILFHIGDASRKWCGYTHSMRDLPDTVVSAVIRADGTFDLDAFVHHAKSTSRYYGFNLNALSKYGSIEFRYFPTAESVEQLAGWINLVQSFAKAAEEIGSLSALQKMLSTEELYEEMVAARFAPYVAAIKGCTTYKEVKLALSEVCSVAKGNNRTQRSFSADNMLAKHPYLGKVLKKSMNKQATVVAAAASAPAPTSSSPRPSAPISLALSTPLRAESPSGLFSELETYTREGF